MRDRATQLLVVSEFLGINPDLFTCCKTAHDNKTLGGNKPVLSVAKFKRLLYVLKRLFPGIYSYVLYPPKRVFHQRPLRVSGRISPCIGTMPLT